MPLSRRTFLTTGCLSAASVAVFGSAKLYAAPSSSPTTSDVLGPFYRPGAPLRSNLIPPGVKGNLLTVKGTIFHDDGQTPLANALIESWQCDPHEQYDNTSDAYLYRGAQRTGTTGEYSFRTLIPPPYPNGEGGWRPAHIHYRIASTDYQDLITQVYFKGAPHIDEHPASSHPTTAHRILPVTPDRDGGHYLRFDITMSKTVSLSDASLDKLIGLYQLNQGMAEFFVVDDLLFIKLNGLILEGMVYQGNNVFEGAFGANRVAFTLKDNGRTACEITMWSYPNFKRWTERYRGERLIKYPG